MKAIRISEYGGPSVLKLAEVPAPEPGPNQVVVRNHAVGVNPVDTYLRGNVDNRGPKLPYTPGVDSAGVVEAVGAGAMNVPYATAYHALFNRAHGQAGDTVLVHGASGGVGIGAVQLARARGLTVIGTAGTERGRRLVLAEGAHHVLDHGAPGYLDEIMKLTGGRGVDVVLEMVANVNLPKDLGIVAIGGRIVAIGSRGTVEINARHAMNRDAAILGMALYHATPAQFTGIHAALVEGLRNGTLRPVIGQELPLGQAPRAHEAVMEPGHHGKIVLVP
ncbi:MAG: NADPH:quinone reductase [Candidatus Rokubacteria bacterium]|nr:NADPH:quinone reductase [Candidatus Rokubacteria bacterium]